ncbi:uncharacterized protein L201_004251 [Kwoniella dendrophila CBS 6074]|uniref:Putative tyrosine-protein phosphatase OCA1 n=1 Tax=Kwoniella dendrophila CBS 6074 TaxID=1295534 RepID=A0AAX4JXR9_9TREE
MITPPFHFSIIASSPYSFNSSNSNNKDYNDEVQSIQPQPEILYRGSIPAPRNKSFIKRLKLKTIITLRKKPLKEDDPVAVWLNKKGIEIKWIKAEGMSEEKLGMGKNEISEVLKILLDPKSYPLYIADKDGISHTTLIVACLRKLQGWNMDCIINEICRFEPEYEDLPLVSFIQSYLSIAPNSSSSSTSSSNQTDSPFTLPHPPYPKWLWPPLTPSNASPITTKQPRDRSTSTSNPTSTKDSTATTTNSSILPFPHPLSIRKHPTMKLTFPMLPPPVPPLASVQTGSTQLSTSTNIGSSSINIGSTSNVPIPSPTLSSTGPGNLSRVNSRRDKSFLPPPIAIPEDVNNHNNNILGQAVSTLHSGLTGITRILSGNGQSGSSIQVDEGDKPASEDNRLGRTVSFHSASERQSQQPKVNSSSTQGQNVKQDSTQSSPMKLSREPTRTASSSDQYVSESTESMTGEDEDDGDQPLNEYVSEYQDDDDEYYEDEDEDDEDDDDDDDDDDEGNEPTSQYISALDLAGFG